MQRISHLASSFGQIFEAPVKATQCKVSLPRARFNLQTLAQSFFSFRRVLLLQVEFAEVEKDLVVMGDGRQVSGAVLIRASKDASGEVKYFLPVLLQNGIVTELTKVEYIKLAKLKRSRKTRHRVH